MASKRRIRRKQCGNKERYDTAQEALAVIAELRRKDKLRGHTTPYKCKFCGKFHFGQTPYRVQQAIKQKQERG